jgi:hypothetical protein
VGVACGIEMWCAGSEIVLRWAATVEHVRRGGGMIGLPSCESSYSNLMWISGVEDIRIGEETVQSTPRTIGLDAIDFDGRYGHPVDIVVSVSESDESSRGT